MRASRQLAGEHVRRCSRGPDRAAQARGPGQQRPARGRGSRWGAGTRPRAHEPAHDVRVQAGLARRGRSIAGSPCNGRGATPGRSWSCRRAPPAGRTPPRPRRGAGRPAKYRRALSFFWTTILTMAYKSPCSPRGPGMPWPAEPQAAAAGRAARDPDRRGHRRASGTGTLAPSAASQGGDRQVDLEVAAVESGSAGAVARADAQEEVAGWVRPRPLQPPWPASRMRWPSRHGRAGWRPRSRGPSSSVKRALAAARRPPPASARFRCLVVAAAQRPVVAAARPPAAPPKRAAERSTKSESPPPEPSKRTSPPPKPLGAPPAGPPPPGPPPPRPRPPLRPDVLACAPVRPKPVVLRALLGVAQHLVGLGDLAEARRGVRVVADVGVVLAREAAVGAADLVGARPARHAEHLVVVAVADGHHSALSSRCRCATATSAGRSTRPSRT